MPLQFKKAQFSEWYSEVLKEAELADLRYNVKGFLVHRPWAVMTMKHMYRLYEEELERQGHEPVWFPVVIPEGNFRAEKEHVEGFVPEVFWVTHGGARELEERLALRPTSETALYPMYALWIQGHRDLPLKLYQSCAVYRHETKATRPFIRGREFHWIESHDAFATRAQAEAQVREDMATTDKVMRQEFGIPFLYFQRPEWDKFPGAVHTYAADTLLPDGKVLQQPSTHLLGQNFSKAFNIRFLNAKGEYEHAWQTCYGPAIWRMLASVVAVHGDDKGLVLPWNLAPVQVVIIPILLKGKEKGVLERCRALAAQLHAAGIRAKCDESEDTPGSKYYRWELRGVPLRVEVGPKEVESRSYTVVRRDTGEKTAVPEAHLAARLSELGGALTKNLVARADKWFHAQVSSADSLEELGKKLKHGGLVRVNFHSIAKDGESCAKLLKEKLQADVRGSLAEPEKPFGAKKCVGCGEKATVVVYAGKQY
jgi:prolyl-tRNA synthetase